MKKPRKIPKREKDPHCGYCGGLCYQGNCTKCGKRRRVWAGVPLAFSESRLLALQAYELAHGNAAQDLVLHSCPNSLCVRPSHLFEGTEGDLT